MEYLDEIAFSVPGEPFGKQRPRVVRMGEYSMAYTPDKTVSYENLVRLCFGNAARGSMFQDTDQLEVMIVACYGIPKSVSSKKRTQMLERKILPTKKPDWDNIGKVICDSLNKVAYHDDSAIVRATVLKYYGEVPKVDVYIKRVEG